MTAGSSWQVFTGIFLVILRPVYAFCRSLQQGCSEHSFVLYMLKMFIDSKSQSSWQFQNYSHNPLKKLAPFSKQQRLFRKRYQRQCYLEEIEEESVPETSYLEGEARWPSPLPTSNPATEHIVPEGRGVTLVGEKTDRWGERVSPAFQYLKNSTWPLVCTDFIVTVIIKCVSESVKCLSTCSDAVLGTKLMM